MTVLSRTWPSWPADETIAGVRHRRLPGYAHTDRLRRNLWRDLLWSWRVWRTLPPADLTIVNCVALPVWLGWWRRSSGRLVVMPGRTPKGQYRLYRRLDRVLAVSSTVRDAVIAEQPRLARLSHVVGYPIDWHALATGERQRAPSAPLSIGFVGRLHREKGLDLLVAALRQLATRSGLPPWRFDLTGPTDVARGGSGDAYAAGLQQALASFLPSGSYALHPPVFSPGALADVYRSIDVFCYPSIAEGGETFGVAVAEAMAAGAVPVVSRLACFTDFVRHEHNGLSFDHRAPNAADQLADALARLLVDADLRRRLASAAQADTRIYGFPDYAARLLADFSTLM